MRTLRETQGIRPLCERTQRLARRRNVEDCIVAEKHVVGEIEEAVPDVWIAVIDRLRAWIASRLRGAVPAATFIEG